MINCNLWHALFKLGAQNQRTFRTTNNNNNNIDRGQTRASEI